MQKSAYIEYIVINQVFIALKAIFIKNIVFVLKILVACKKLLVYIARHGN